VELRDLEYFLAVAEERSFTRGAQRALIVQSAASAAVHRLERELGHRLLDRGTRGVELTDAGRLVLGRARTLREQARAVRDDLDALAGGLRGSVTLGTVLSTGELDLPAILTGFHRLHPGISVRLRLSAGPENQHLQRLLAGEFDLSLVPQPDRPPAGVTITPVAQIRLVLLCRRDDPLARARDVRYRDIATCDYVDFPALWATGRWSTGCSNPGAPPVPWPSKSSTSTARSRSSGAASGSVSFRTMSPTPRPTSSRSICTNHRLNAGSDSQPPRTAPSVQRPPLCGGPSSRQATATR